LLNLEVGDETGFTAQIKAPLKVEHKVIGRGQVAEMIVMSNRPDLSRIEEITEVYIPNRGVWVCDYPCLRRDFFNEVTRRLRDDLDDRPRRRPSREPRRERYRDEEDYI
jgi:hypothetical protein